ncbi:MAG: hypothetical protein L0Z46_02755 [Nitrospiraceae bacterium]|nr:hypothetical protein [Nitrospiraceae bacterium]
MKQQRYKAKSPGRVAAMIKLNQAGLGGMGGRRPTHGRNALAELLKRGMDPDSEIAVVERDLTGAYLSDLGGEATASAMDKGLVKRLVALDLDFYLLKTMRERGAKFSRVQLFALLQAQSRNAVCYGQTVKALGGPGRRPAQINGEIIIKRYADAPGEKIDPPAKAF